MLHGLCGTIDLPRTSYPVLIKPVGEDLPDGQQLSLEEMKHTLRAAEERLSGRVLSQAKTQVYDAQASQATAYSLPKLQHTLPAEPYLTVNSAVARLNPVKIANNDEGRLATQPLSTAASLRAKTTKAKGPASSAGADWFDLPRTNLTPGLKRDLQLLKLRSTWDPKRHYKKDNQKALVPEYSQVGTILEGPTEYYSSRIPKRDRKRSFIEEIVATEEGTNRFKEKYNDIQASKTSGRRAYYKQLKQKRSKGFLRR